MDNLVSCVIIEDDDTAAAMAKDIITSNFPHIHITASIVDIKTAQEQLSLLNPDFVLLDVNLADGDAFTLLRGMKEIPFKIIFATSFDTYAIDAFKYSALDYLLKPYAPNDLVLAVAKVLKELDKEQYHLQMQALFDNIKKGAPENKKLVLKNLETIHVVAVKDIVYIQSDNNYSTFYTSDRKKVVVSKTLKSFEEKLKGSHFLRIHQSYLINLDHVKSVNKKADSISLSGTVSLPISQSKKKILFHYLDTLP